MTHPRLSDAVWAIIRRDLLLAYRRRADVLTMGLFFVVVASLFPLGVGPEPATLELIAPGVLWVAAVLSCLLSLGRVFTTDYLDGMLEQMVLAPHPLTILVLAKIVAHWVVAGLPVVLLSPMLGLQFGLGGEVLAVLTLSLLLGTPLLSLIGAVGAALTLGVRGSGALVPLLVLPLFMPVVIFGAGAVANSASGIGAEANLSLLGAGLLLAIALAPWAIATALRLAVE